MRHHSPSSPSPSPTSFSLHTVRHSLHTLSSLVSTLLAPTTMPNLLALPLIFPKPGNTTVKPQRFVSLRIFSHPHRWQLQPPPQPPLYNRRLAANLVREFADLVTTLLYDVSYCSLALSFSKENVWVLQLGSTDLTFFFFLFYFCFILCELHASDKVKIWVGSKIWNLGWNIEWKVWRSWALLAVAGVAGKRRVRREGLLVRIWKKKKAYPSV